MRALLRPRWIALIVVALVAVGVMVGLGRWQWIRHEDRQAANELVASRALEPTAPLDEVAQPVPDDEISTADAGEVAFRSVEATGRFDPDAELLVANRSLGGAPGWWVLTPLVHEEGGAVLVNRGFVPLVEGQDRRRELYAPPDGDVTVTGLLVEALDGPGSARPAGLPDDELAWIDLEVAAEGIDEPLVPAVLEQSASEPPTPGDLPRPVPEPELDDGPHLGYAVQWWAFAAIAAVVSLLLLTRAVRRERAGAAS